MLSLLQAIRRKFTADGTLMQAFPGGMFRDRAPEGTATYPYLVSTVASSPTESYYGGPHENSVAVQFTAYGVGHDATGTAMELFDSRFADSILQLTAGQQNVNCYRMLEPRPLMQTAVDQSGQEIWAWTVTYVYVVVN